MACDGQKAKHQNPCQTRKMELNWKNILCKTARAIFYLPYLWILALHCMLFFMCRIICNRKISGDTRFAFISGTRAPGKRRRMVIQLLWKSSHCMFTMILASSNSIWTSLRVNLRDFQQESNDGFEISFDFILSSSRPIWCPMDRQFWWEKLLHITNWDKFQWRIS